jgi:hypothetical protein
MILSVTMTFHSFRHEHCLFPLQIHDVISPRWPVHNIFTVNRNKLAMNFCSSFSSRVKKSNYYTNLTFGMILNQHGHFKYTLRAQRCRDYGQWALPCHMVPISQGSTTISEEKRNPLHFYRTLSLHIEYPSYIKYQLRIKVASSPQKMTQISHIGIYV